MFLTLSSPADYHLFAIVTIIFAEFETSTETQVLNLNLQILGVWFSFS